MDMNDTSPQHPLLTRRSMLLGLGLMAASGVVTACSKSAPSASGATTATENAPTLASSTTVGSASAGAASCVLTAEQEQGPYWFHAAKVRSDITDGRPGVPMALEITVVDATTCRPISGAGVDVWHADALGAYSNTADGLFLRGIQLTDAGGVARFNSIYPGWYPSRTNHVHLKVHIGGDAGATYTGGHVSHTGNLFFPEDTSTALARAAAYLGNTARRVPLTQDFVYRGQNGSGSIMTIVPIDGGDPMNGVRATMVVGVDPKATPAGIGIAGEVS